MRDLTEVVQFLYKLFVLSDLYGKCSPFEAVSVAPLTHQVSLFPGFAVCLTSTNTRVFEQFWCKVKFFSSKADSDWQVIHLFAWLNYLLKKKRS